eukprot:10840541-Prorocentrum_lima.AAC.1
MTSSLVGSEMCIRDRKEGPEREKSVPLVREKGSNQAMLEKAGIDVTKTIAPINMWLKRSRDTQENNPEAQRHVYTCYMATLAVTGASRSRTPSTHS